MGNEPKQFTLPVDKNPGLRALACTDHAQTGCPGFAVFQSRLCFCIARVAVAAS